jgi:hypothetical protein
MSAFAKFTTPKLGASARQACTNAAATPAALISGF